MTDVRKVQSELDRLNRHLPKDIFSLICTYLPMPYPEGDNYEGEYYKGKFHGKGKYVWKDKYFYSMYRGEWKNGKKVLVTDAVKNITESSKQKDIKDTYICEYEFNNEIFRFVLQRDENSFLNVQGYESKESILWEEEDILILGGPIQDMLEKNQLIYRTITLDKESGKFNTVATAEPGMEEYEDGIWALVNGSCEKLN